MARTIAFACALAAVLATGCGSDRATRGEGTLEVVATTVPLADIVRNAGGRRVRVLTIVPRGSDPHRYRPRPEDLDAVRDADLLVRSGGDVDAWAAELDSGRRLAVLPLVDPLPRASHWWLDPVRTQRAVKEIRNELARADVNGAGYYEAASADFLARLRRLDDGIERCLLEAFPPRARLAAEHDALAYFSDRYGVGIVPLGRASAARRLWTDTLGPAGSGTGTYLGAMAANTAAIVDGLSGGDASCRPPS